MEDFSVSLLTLKCVSLNFETNKYIEHKKNKTSHMKTPENFTQSQNLNDKHILKLKTELGHDTMVQLANFPLPSGRISFGSQVMSLPLHFFSSSLCVAWESYRTQPWNPALAWET